MSAGLRSAGACAASGHASLAEYGLGTISIPTLVVTEFQELWTALTHHFRQVRILSLRSERDALS